MFINFCHQLLGIWQVVRWSCWHEDTRMICWYGDFLLAFTPYEASDASGILFGWLFLKAKTALQGQWITEAANLAASKAGKFRWIMTMCHGCVGVDEADTFESHPEWKNEQVLMTATVWYYDYVCSGPNTIEIGVHCFIVFDVYFVANLWTSAYIVCFVWKQASLSKTRWGFLRFFLSDRGSPLKA